MTQPRAESWLKTWPVPALHAVLLCAIAPSWSQPFQAPKLAALLLGAALLGLWSIAQASPGRAWLGSPRRWTTWLSLLWLAVAVLSSLRSEVSTASALLLEGAAALLLFALLQLDWDRKAALGALALLGTAHAGVVILQALSLDPLQLFGLHAQLAGPRMAVYGLLGNPDFAAAWLGAVLPITLGLALAGPRWLWPCAIAQLAALACARSMGSSISLSVALLVLAIAQPRRRRWIALAAVPALLIVAAGLAGREPLRSAQGRLQLARIGFAQLTQAPLLGLGPGSVEPLFPAWAAQDFARRTPTSQAAVKPFAAPQDHLHDDFLERAVEEGLVGMATFLALLAIGLQSALVAARRDLHFAGCAAAIASLAARSMFDFPAARPAELALLVTLIACAVREGDAPPPRAFSCDMEDPSGTPLGDLPTRIARLIAAHRDAG